MCLFQALSVTNVLPHTSHTNCGGDTLVEKVISLVPILPWFEHLKSYPSVSCTELMLCGGGGRELLFELAGYDELWIAIALE